MRSLRAALAVVLVLAAAGAVAGLGDLAENAVGYSAWEGMGTALLWIALASIAAIPVAFVAAGLCLSLPGRSASRIAAAVLWLALQGAILFGFRSGAFGLAAGLAGSAAALLAAAWIARRDDPLAAVGARAGLVLAAVLPLSIGVVLLRPDYPEASGLGRGTGPNVVLIVLDTLRADHLGAYGDTRGLSPAFDALARQGTIFEDAYANAPWTVPSHASLFTGLSARAHGATSLHHRWLDGRFTTIAESLKERGYATAMLSANRYLREANLAQGCDSYRPLGERFEGLWIRRALETLGWPAKWADHGAADGVEAVEDWLEKTGGSRFLFVNLIEPHWRYLPPFPERGAHLPEGMGVVEATRTSRETYGPLLMAAGRSGEPTDSVLRAMYAAAVRYQDRQLGRLVALLDAELGEDTILVITSDHGENLGEAGRYDHVFAVNDHLAHVPLLVRYPPAFPAGKRVAGLCELADVPVTIAELVPGAKLGEGVTGATLVPGRFQPRPFVVVEGDPYYGHLERMGSAAGFQRDVGAFAQPLVALRTPERKLVLQGHAAPRLHDPRADRDEARDLLGAEPAVAEELLRLLEAWRKSIEPYRRDESAAAGAPLSEEARERLRRLGYAGHDD
ncbi:MAG: sulfatase [Planctomycetota bacterium]